LILQVEQTSETSHWQFNEVEQLTQIPLDAGVKPVLQRAHLLAISHLMQLVSEEGQATQPTPLVKLQVCSVWQHPSDVLG
jgi:hypothetical protein